MRQFAREEQTGLISLPSGWLGALFLSLSLLAGLAAPTRMENPDYLIDNWQGEDELRENSAATIAQTADGYLWVGTYDGLVRFNGHDFTPARAIAGIPPDFHDTVFRLHADSTGRLWVATERQVALFHEGKWETHATFSNNTLVVRSLATDTAGRLWAGTLEGGLFEVRTNGLVPVSEELPLIRSGVFCCADKADGRLWVANRGYIGYRSTNGWQAVGQPEADRRTLVATAAHGGGLWVYFQSTRTLRRFHSNGLVEEFPAPLVSDVREIYETQDGNILLASILTGLTIIKPGETNFSRNLTIANGLANNVVLSLMEDRENNLWVGTGSGGLHRLVARRFSTVGLEQGLPNPITRTIIEEAPGRYVVGTHGGGMARIRNGRVTSVHLAPNSPSSASSYVWSALKDQSGRLWLGTFNGGLFFEENGLEQSFTGWPKPLGNTICTLLQDSRKRIWAGTQHGLALIQGERAQLWLPSPQHPLAQENIRCLAEEPRTGALWIGTYYNGIYRLDGEQLTHFSTGEGLPSGHITALTVDEAGYVWAGVFGEGLVCIHDGHVTRIGQNNGLPADTIGSIVPDGLGNYWLGSERGVIRVAAAELQRGVQSPGATLNFFIFDCNDGLANVQCAASFQPTAIRDTAGHIWFATQKGVASINPATLRLNTNPPPVIIESFSYTDQSGMRHTIQSPTKPLRLPAGAYELRVAYVALSLTAPDKNRFACRMLGPEFNFSETNQIGYQSFYRRLRPGDYTFTVRAANNDGYWNERPAKLEFSVQPFVWEQRWFWALLFGATGAALGYGGWQLARSQLARQLAQLRAERERVRLATVMEKTSDLVIFADAEHTIVHVNPAGRRLLGLSMNASAPANFAELHPAAEHARLLTEALPTARRNGTWEGETVLQTTAGPLPVSAVVIVNQTAAGQVNFICTVARDISERKKGEEMLQALLAGTAAQLGEDFFRPLVEHLAKSLRMKYAFVGEYISGHKVRVISVWAGQGFGDPFTYDLADTPCDNVVGKQLCVYPSRIQEEFPKDILLQQMGVESYLGAPMIDRNGQPLGLLVVLHDQSMNHADVELNKSILTVFAARAGAELERVRAAAARRQSEERFREIARHINEVFWIRDAATFELLYISPAYETVWGRSCDELLAQPEHWFTAIIPEDRLRIQHATTEQSVTGSYDVEYQITRPDGKIRRIHDRAVPVRDDTGKVVRIIGVAEDITRHRELEAQLRQSQKMEAVGQLSGGVAHDFNNLLAVISGNVSLLELDHTLLPDQREAINEIKHSSERAATLTRQLLAFSRRQTLQPRNLDLNGVLENMGKMCRRILGEDIEMTLRFASRPAIVCADPGMMEQVLLNLVVNARDAMPLGGKLDVTISLVELPPPSAGSPAGARAGKFVVLTVQDNGTGIAPEILPRIFEPFFTTKDVGKGTGLGLATVYGIIQQHQGWITVQSTVAQGTRFDIHLPQLADNLRPDTTPYALRQPGGGAETILLVEDEPALRKLVVRVLSRLGYQILEAGSGQQALEVWQHHRGQIHLLLTDMVMPDGLGGAELARRLQSEEPQLNVVLMSGYNPESLQSGKTWQEGVNFIAKPFDQAAIASVVRAALDGKKKPSRTQEI